MLTLHELDEIIKRTISYKENSHAHKLEVINLKRDKKYYAKWLKSSSNAIVPASLCVKFNQKTDWVSL